MSDPTRQPNQVGSQRGWCTTRWSGTHQRVDLESLHDSYRDGRVRDRIKAVLLRSEDWSTPMIVQAFRIHEISIVRHINDFIKSAKLWPNNGYLNAEKTQQLI